MRIGRFEFSLKRVPDAGALTGASATPPSERGRWLQIFDWRPGAWQSHDPTMDAESVLAQATVFACIGLIATDIGKLSLRTVEQTADRVWRPVDVGAATAALRKPNRYQTRQKFIEQWTLSKLTHGNTYVLKERDRRGNVVALYVLDPSKVQPLVAPNGEVYYALQPDNLSGITEPVTAAPASEVIHDRGLCLFHPLVGVSPIFACGLAATQALRIGRNSARFFENMSRPSGVLTAPAEISDETAQRLKDAWQKNYTGDKVGNVAVLGDGLDYKPLSVTAHDAQLVEQLKLSAEQVCAVFHVPAYMVGAAPAPAYNNIESLNQQYYSQCLQQYMEAIEALLDEGLGLTAVPARTLGVEFDLDDLLKMDSATQIDALGKATGAGWLAPNEARLKRNLPPVLGGDTPYLQQQNYSLAALAKRDAREDPFGSGGAPAAADANEEPDDGETQEPPEPAGPTDAEDESKAAVGEQAFMAVIRACAARLDLEALDERGA